MSMKVVKVEWVDSSGVQGGWKFFEDFNTELVRVTSIGFLIKETDELIALSLNYGNATINSPEQINGVITIQSNKRKGRLLPSFIMLAVRKRRWGIFYSLITQKQKR